MSNETFNISTNQVDCPHPLLHQDLQLGLASDDHYSKFISLSPDSAQNCISSSEREATISSDVNMQACSLSKDSHVESIHSTSSLQGNLLCSVSTNLNQTFIATPVDASLHCWNANLTPTCNHETGLEIKKAFDKNMDNGRNGNAMSPDSTGGESLTGLREVSYRGSTDNGGCSLSSEEMVIRSNSFCLEDQSPLVVSSLEDSPMHLTAACQALAAEFQLSEGEKSPGIVCEEKTSHPGLGMTFTQADLSSVENKMATESLIDLPSEKEGLFMTFVCERSPEDLRKEAQFPSESEGLFSTSVTPEQGKAVLPTPSIVEKTNNNRHTSTPIQGISNKIPSLASFSGSPETGKAVSPEHPSVEQQQTSAASKHEVALLPPSAGKIRKLQLKKFPKTDFSNIKSKVVTRNFPRMTTGFVSECKPPKCNTDNKHVEGKTGGTIRISPAKAKDTTLVSTTTKMIKVAKMGRGTSNLGSTVMAPSRHSAVDEQDKSGPELPVQNPPTDTYASAAQRRNASSETAHLVPCQMADAAEHHAGNQTFCLSSREKSLQGSGQIDLKPTLKKHLSDKIKDRAGSALGQNKPSFFKTRLRCSSERSSSQAPKEKKVNIKFSNSFCVPTLTKRRDLTAPQDKQTAQAEDKKGQEKLKRGTKKISLFVSNNL